MWLSYTHETDRTTPCAMGIAFGTLHGMDAGTKVLENKLRRIAERRGFVVRKKKRIDPHAVDYGKFALSIQGEPQDDFVVKDVDIDQLNEVLNMEFNADDYYNNPGMFSDLINKVLNRVGEDQ